MHTVIVFLVFVWRVFVHRLFYSLLVACRFEMFWDLCVTQDHPEIHVLMIADDVRFVEWNHVQFVEWIQRNFWGLQSVGKHAHGCPVLRIRVAVLYTIFRIPIFGPRVFEVFLRWKPLLHPKFQCFGLGEHLIPKTSNLNHKLKLPTLYWVSCAGILFAVMTWNKHSSQSFPVVVLFFVGDRWMSSRRTPIRIWSSWRRVCLSSIWNGEEIHIPLG